MSIGKAKLLQSKLPDVGTTIFAVMTKMANDHGAINLSQGFPDFEVSKELIDGIYKSMLEGKNQYAPMPGLPQLKTGIQSMIRNSYGHNPDPDSEITVTAGATEAIFSSLMALVNTGDEVIMFDPAYDCYDPAVKLAGGISVHIPLTQPDFHIDWDRVRKSITPNTRLIMINSPQNPSGAVLSESDLDELEKVIADNDILVLSDEVYEHIIFDGIKHQSILRRESLRENGLAIFSFGKTFHATGWKVGYVISPEFITSEVRKVHQFLTYSVNTPMQWGLAAYAENPKNYLNLPAFYQEKRDKFLNLIKDSRFTPVPCHGTYFQLLSYSGIDSIPEMQMAEELTKKHGLASIPVSAFYADRQENNLLRFCFAKNDDTLQQAAEILCKI
jgi:methionine aminotransferase